MKITKLTHLTRSAAAAALRSACRGALLGLAVGLAGFRVAAMPSVNTLGGGPSAGYVDGTTFSSSMFNTPVGLALDKLTIN